jgi:hypothetical protein
MHTAPQPSRVPNSRLPFAETAPPLGDVVHIVQATQGVAPPGHAAAYGQSTQGVQAEQRYSGGPVPLNAVAAGLGGTVASAGVEPAVPRVLLGFLVSFDNNALGQSWALHRGTLLLGRAGAASSAAVEIPHATVSSRHATLNVTQLTPPGSVPQGPGMPSVRAARVFLLDHGSTNGTYVNDAALAPDQQCELQDGDRVRLGLFNLIVKII